MNREYVRLLVALALCEDLSPVPDICFKEFLSTGRIKGSDVTSEAVFKDRDTQSAFRVITRSPGVLSGLDVFKEVFSLLNNRIEVNAILRNGDSFKSGDTICKLSGPALDILKGERTALNFLGHLSGIATEVNRLVNAAANGNIKILDTRKTTPGMRILEKMAVRHGGGLNHRMGLYDMVLIKDNHIDSVGSIKDAVDRVKSSYGGKFKIEVEARNLSEVREAVEAGVNRIMLDNMSPREVGEAVKLVPRGIEVEVSGNMNEEKIKQLKGIRVDYVSVGYITYNVKRVDFSMISL